jgi:hypothetical protein
VSDSATKVIDSGVWRLDDDYYREVRDQISREARDQIPPTAITHSIPELSPLHPERW